MTYRRRSGERMQWVKSVGSQEDPLHDDWPRSRADLLDWVWFSKYPRSLRAGDILVYYAAGRRVFPALFELISDEVVPDADHPVQPSRWMWKMRVRPTLILRMPSAPSPEEGGVRPSRLKRQSHIHLDDAEYASIRDAILERARLATA